MKHSETSEVYFGVVNHDDLSHWIFQLSNSARLNILIYADW